jgi:threonine aldolase
VGLDAEHGHLVNFTSDNCYGAAPEIAAAIAAANRGTESSYGGDAITARLGARFSELFEREVFVFPVVSGTAANALALATLVPPHGAILCHDRSHIAVHECGAVEFYTHGARLMGLHAADGKLTAQIVEAALGRFEKGSVHEHQPGAISITQATEMGTVYRSGEIAALSMVARANGMKLHMDGARFANAVAALNASPADITWRAGVDVLSFGATKNGALGAEAVVFFSRDDVRDFEFRRKRGGHLLSKMRFASAQLEAHLHDGLWLKLASRANTLAARLAEGLKSAEGAIPVWPVEANEVFVRLPHATVARLRKAGAVFDDWEPPGDGSTLIRLVTSFATPDADVSEFLRIARG